MNTVEGGWWITLLAILFGRIMLVRNQETNEAIVCYKLKKKKYIVAKYRDEDELFALSPECKNVSASDHYYVKSKNQRLSTNIQWW